MATTTTTTTTVNNEISALEVSNILASTTDNNERIFLKYSLEDYSAWRDGTKKELIGNKIAIFTNSKVIVIQDIKVDVGTDTSENVWKAWKSMFILASAFAKVKLNIKQEGGSMPSLMPTKGTVSMYNKDGINIFSSDLYGDCADSIRFAPKTSDLQDISKPKEVRDAGFRQAKAMFTLLGADKLIKQYRYEKEPAASTNKKSLKKESETLQA